MNVRATDPGTEDDVKVTFPGMAGTIGKRRYYATMMSLSEVPRFFKFNDWEQVDPGLRAQRVLNESRVPDIKKYMVDNEDGYIFSSITASYKSDTVQFRPMEGDARMGTIEMDLENMEFIINDGQHRAAAIALALKDNPELGKEQISVLLFETEDLSRLQQMFTDLNRYAHKTSKSLDILYDHRDTLSTLTMEMAELVPAFVEMVDKEKTSLPLRSPKLLTLSALYDANEELLGDQVGKPGSEEFQKNLGKAVEYWTEVAKVIPDWQQVREGRLLAAALRQEKINTHGVVLRALGAAGSALLQYHPEDWQECLARLRQVDWRKAVGTRVNPLWDNVCIVAGSVASNRQARKATQAVLKAWLELPPDAQERQILTNLHESGWVGLSSNDSNRRNGRQAAEMASG